MEEIKAPKKERKFLKAMGDIALTLFRELVLGIGKKVINKVGNKRQGLVIAFVLVAGISYASIDSIPYPVTGNKQRLGWQTSGNGLVYRGRSNDTITKPSSYVDKNVKAYLLLDSVRGTIFVWRQTYWDSILVGSGAFAQPIDSLFFDTSVPSNNVDTAKMRWDSDLATVVLGLNDNVPNELGFKNFWLVKNQTGSTITKGSLVYANGTVGASGRITVDKFIANGSIDAKYLLGITAHDLTDGEDGYVISFGKIRQVNTDTFAAGAILYPSPTVAGVWTDVEPVAPNIDMPIGFCINSSVNNGTIAIRVASGYKLSELHDIAISSPIEKASLYYSGGLWRDTTAALLVSDTASMLSNYATKAYADTTGRLYARQDFTNVSSSTLTWTQSDTLIPGGVNVVQVYRNGQILLPSQYTIPTSTSMVIAASSFKVNDNYTVIFPRGGGAGSGGGSGSLTSITAGTGIVVSPNPITTTGTVSADLSVLMELTDTTLLNLPTRFASKLNTTDTASLSNRIDAKGTGTVTSVATGYGLTGGTITTTGTLVLDSAVVFSRIKDSIVDVAIGNDTIKILKQEYAPATTSVLTWTITPKFPMQLKQYILVFRNGQLLINDQYNLTDTNKITIVSNSFKVGANYTVVTVSGIGSVGTGVFPNPIYPEAGIALSTGSTWASSIPNNSTNWNTAFTDRLKWDGGSTGLVPSTGRTSLGGTTIGQSMFTLTNPSTISFPRFNADNTVTSRSAANFRTDIGAGTVTSVNVAAGTPMSIGNNTTTPEISMAAATGSVNGYLTSTDWTTFNNKQNALGFTPANSTITINTTSPLQGGGNLSANRTLSILSASDDQSGIVNTTAQLFSGNKVFKHRLTADSLFYLNNTSPIPTAILGIDLTGGVNSVGKFTLGNGLSITSSTLLADTNLLVTRFDTASMLTPYFRDADTSLLNLTSRFAAKLNYTDTSFLFTQSDTSQLNLTSRFAAKLNLSDTSNMLVPYLRKADTTLMLSKYLRRADTSLLNLTSRFAAKLNISDTASMLTPYFRDADTSLLNLTSRFAAKLNYTDTSFLFTQSDTSQLNLTSRFAAKLNLSDTSNMLVPYLRKADTTLMLSKYLRRADTSLLNLTSRFAAKLNISDTASMLTPYFRDADTTSLNLTSRFAEKQNTLSNASASVSGILTSTDWNTFNNKQTAIAFAPPLQNQSNVVTISQASSTDNGYLSIADWNTFNNKFNTADTSLLNLTSRFAEKQNTLNGTGFVKASGTSITYDNSSYLRTGLADSTYLKLTGGTLTGGLSGTTGVFISNNLPQLSLGINGIAEETRLAFITGSIERFKIFSTNSQSSITFQSPAQESAARGYRFISSWNTDSNLGLVQDPRGNVGIKSDATGNDVHPNTLYVNGTLGVTGATTLGSTLAVTGDITEAGNNVLTSADTTSMLLPYLRKADTTSMLLPYFRDADTTSLNLTSRFNTKLNLSDTLNMLVPYLRKADTASLSSRIDSKFNSAGGTISGAVTLSTTTATPTSLLGKDGNNVVGTVTTVAQTGLMTRGETTATTGSPSATFTVTHGLGFNPSAILVTSAGIGGGDKIIFEVYTKNSTTFSVQAWNYDGTEASSKTVKIYWLALK